MSPVHNSKPFNTRLLRLARLLLASSTSVLVSIHIPAAAGPHHYKSVCCRNGGKPKSSTLLCRLFLFFSLLCLFSCCFFLPFPLSHPFSPVPPLPPSSPVRFKGMTYKLVDQITYSLGCRSSVPDKNKVQHYQDWGEAVKEDWSISDSCSIFTFHNHLVLLSSLSPAHFHPHCDTSSPICLSF